MNSALIALSGAAAFIWIIFGVLIAASRYPGYNHRTQFLSELGATGSPTQKFSPLVNNFPLAFLFMVFGWFLFSRLPESLSVKVMGGSVIAHGLATLIAGIWSMDSDPYTQTPSLSGKIHASAGAVMFISLVIVPVASVCSPLFGWDFKIFTAVCIALSLVTSILLAKAFTARGAVGLYQRLSYGAQLLWLSCLSWWVFLTRM